MKFEVLTIFPDMFSAHLSEGVLGRAVKKGIVRARIINIRDFARGVHKTTDDRPYGGGDGMVMKPGPIYRALKSIDRVNGRSLVILLSPQGKPFDQATAWELSTWDQIILICGRYEGVDERIRRICIDRELSVGDFILSGGELGAMIVMDATSRLIPGVLGGERSNLEDSFEEGLLEYPQYTRPRVFLGEEVPSVLLSGDHEKIRLWRRTKSLKRTLDRRPDLLKKARLTREDEEILAKIKK
ncbi:MAG: tRNA (guanosine(37)-N1)-methyltransferase TrmD [Desulfobacteraceae bacterium]|jgi:tRNA (guanine37-N1)-methyltransferase|nr:tRNA (guanosine(37)-N1)-methyltransferase TrmD [Desulfobacteraceae bacterium]